MSLVFQNIDPPLRPATAASVSSPTPKQKRGVHTRRAARGVGGQYFGRRETGLPSYSNILSTLSTFPASNDDLVLKVTWHNHVRTLLYIDFGNSSIHVGQKYFTEDTQDRLYTCIHCIAYPNRINE
jgi:hypothetical protein